ncbi:NAD-dependent glyceraldehyde-3-phosphate dehydrogenase [Sporolactobacillus inulinus]|uniref:NAD-dependent glyceraldehyde-3-phosphate dehydrogenase n=1 Tax=Sporolactobacillus inulinus TaxID=2078 RepID=A0A4Y1ZDX3_9BACL|nr:NAD-dependent glyceraldehyde-3-phosphate dehydrogenase [Sporolactobacillus inulinus]
MTVKVGINGFGRIGRLAFRRIQDVPELEVVAVNDLTDPAMLANLLKYDTTQGRFNGEVKVEEGFFVVNGKKVKFFHNATQLNCHGANSALTSFLNAQASSLRKTKLKHTSRVALRKSLSLLLQKAT